MFNVVQFSCSTLYTYGWRGIWHVHSVEPILSWKNTVQHFPQKRTHLRTKPWNSDSQPRPTPDSANSQITRKATKPISLKHNERLREARSPTYNLWPDEIRIQLRHVGISTVLISILQMLRMIWRAVVLVFADGFVRCGAGEPEGIFGATVLAELSVRIWRHDIAG